MNWIGWKKGFFKEAHLSKFCGIWVFWLWPRFLKRPVAFNRMVFLGILCLSTRMGWTMSEMENLVGYFISSHWLVLLFLHLLVYSKASAATFVVSWLDIYAVLLLAVLISTVTKADWFGPKVNGYVVMFCIVIWAIWAFKWLYCDDPLPHKYCCGYYYCCSLLVCRFLGIYHYLIG